MFIFEEYARRINNYQSSLVRYSEESVIFLKNPHHQILKINKILSNNKFKIRNISNYKTIEVIVDWDDYESYINENFKGLKKAITNKKDIFIFGWEYFLIQNQKHFIDNYGHNFFYKSINLKTNRKKRIKNIIKIVDDFKLNFQKIYNNWLEFKKNIDNYSFWLAEIVNDKAC